MTRDLIVFGEDWGRLPSSTQHLIGHLAKHRRVLWINSIGLRSPQFTLKDIKRAWQKLTAKKSYVSPALAGSTLAGSTLTGSTLAGSALMGSTAGSTQADNVANRYKSMSIPPNLTVINPTTLPAPRTKLARYLASQLLSRQLKPIIKAAKLHDPILWTSLPTAVDMADKLNTSSLVYYCGDDFSSLAGVDHHTVSQRERELIARADLILAASETLYQRFRSSRTQFIPHGVDYALFSTPAPPAADLPHNGRPTAGFYGSISEWLDYDLLEKTISLLPDWNFIFIGNISEKSARLSARLSAYKNTYFFGARPHYQLPSYSQHWTASLLPFLNNAQINSCNPLKLMEYLAAGRPVISTPFPALQHHQPFVNVVKTAQETVSALENVRYQYRNLNQQMAVKPHTWQARAHKLEQWLDEL